MVEIGGENPRFVDEHKGHGSGRLQRWDQRL